MNQVVQSKFVKSGWLSKAVWAVPLLIVVAGGVGFVLLREGGATANSATSYVIVTPRNLDVTVRKDGELQAVNNIDVISEVEGSVTIQTLVREGSSVKKGDTLVVLDAAQTRLKIDDTMLEVQRAEADVVNAREMLEIQKSQNATNLEAAQVNLENSQIDLKKYTEGDYPKNLATAQAALQMADINLKNLELDFDQVQELAARGFLTPTDIKAREVQLIKARNELRDAQAALRNLTTYDNQKALTSLRSNLAQAEARLVRVQRENSANLTQRQTDLSSREQTEDMKKRTLERLQKQLAASTILAPEDGLVVYATSGDRNAQQPIQEGAQVRERQMILRLPDTSSMRAVVRIQEAQVARLREGQRASVTIPGVGKPIGGVISKISVLADNSQRWWNPDLKEYPVEIDLDETPPGLKPGVGAAAEIYVARLENVIAVPVSTIYSSGQKAFVFLKPVGEEAPKPKEIKLGLASDTHVQVREGLEGGEEIVVLQAGQGRELLSKAGIADEPATRPSMRRGGPGGEGGGPGRPGGAGGGAGSGAGGGAGPGAAVPASNREAGEAKVQGGERKVGERGGNRSAEAPKTGEAPATRPAPVTNVPGK